MRCQDEDAVLVGGALDSAVDSGAGVLGDRGRGGQRPSWADLLHTNSLCSAQQKAELFQTRGMKDIAAGRTQQLPTDT